MPDQPLSRPARVSYAIMAVAIVLVGWLHLATPLLAALFSYFAITKLQFPKPRGKWLAVALFLLLLGGITYGIVFFVEQAIEALPKVAEKAIPTVIQWAKENQVQLPFTDLESLKALGVDFVKEQVGHLGTFANFAKGATRQFVFFVIGVVVAISVFLNAQMELDRHRHAIANNLYSLTCEAIAERFRSFYQSFATVMGAQMTISAINTVLTMIFVLAVKLPYPEVIIGVTFLCGLLPVVGNLVSNTIIVGIAATISIQMAAAALVFLVVIHKLEYFLNSKIIGGRIRNPVWLTLLALILGEKLMGVPGMILAPVVLHYLKVEASRIEVQPTAPESGNGESPAA